MRCLFDPDKSRKLRANPKRALGFEDLDFLKTEDYVSNEIAHGPDQHRAIGLVGSKLYTVIYEERDDAKGTYFWLVTLWQSTRTERNYYAEYFRP